LLDGELYSPASSRQPSGGSIGAIVGPCIEGNRRTWGSLTNGVDDSFEYCKVPGRQADAGSDYNTVVARRTELTLYCRSSGFIRPDETNVGLPSTLSELLPRNRDAGVNLFNGHAWWQSGVRKIHSLRIVAQQQNPRHESSAF